MWNVDGCSLMISSMRYFKIISLSCSLTCPSAIVFKVRCYLMVIFIWLVVPEQVLPLLSRLNPSSQLQRWLPNRFLQLCWQFPLLPAHSFISIREKKIWQDYWNFPQMSPKSNTLFHNLPAKIPLQNLLVTRRKPLRQLQL